MRRTFQLSILYFFSVLIGKTYLLLISAGESSSIAQAVIQIDVQIDVSYLLFKHEVILCAGEINAPNDCRRPSKIVQTYNILNAKRYASFEVLLLQRLHNSSGTVGVFTLRDIPGDFVISKKVRIEYKVVEFDHHTTFLASFLQTSLRNFTLSDGYTTPKSIDTIPTATGTILLLRY